MAHGTSVSSDLGSDTFPTFRKSGLWVIAGVLCLVYLVLHLWNLNERYAEFKWDGVALGGSAHLLWSLAQGLHPMAPSGAEVASYSVPVVLYLLAPLYHLWPSPFFLLLVQTLALAAAAGAIFFLNSCYLPRLRALVLTLFFCFYPPVVAMGSASFHPAILAVPFLALSILSVLRGSPKALFVFILCALACDLRTGLLIAPVAAWKARRSEDRRWWIAAFFLAFLGIAGRGFYNVREGMGPVIFYGALTAPHLFWALSAFERWADRILTRRSLVLALASPVCFVGAVFASAVITPSLVDSHPGVSQLPVRKSAVNALIDRIPANAQVWTSPLFLPKFSNRPDTALLTDDAPLEEGARSVPRYALVDLSDAGLEQASEMPELTVVKRLVKRGWGPIASAGAVTLFSETPGKALQPLYASVTNADDRPFLYLRALTAGPAELTGFTMTPDEEDLDRIRFMFYWKKNQPGSRDFAVRLDVVDPSGTTVYSSTRPMCYGLYPFSSWHVGETVKDEFWFVVPERLQNSSYEVRLTLLQMPDHKMVPLKTSVSGASDSAGRIRLIALDAI